MASKKTTSRPTRKAVSVSQMPAAGLTPNDLPDAMTPEHVQALEVTCQFLGKTFYEGDTICYQSAEWVCGAAGWSKTGNAC